MNRRISAPLTFALLLGMPLMLGSGWGNPGCSSGIDKSRTEGRWEMVATGPGVVEWSGGSVAPDAAGDFYVEASGYTFVLPCSQEGFLCPFEKWLPEADGLFHFGERVNEMPQRFHGYADCVGPGCPGAIETREVEGFIDGSSFDPTGGGLFDDCTVAYGDLTFDERDRDENRYTHVSGELSLFYERKCLRTVDGDRITSAGPSVPSGFHIVQPVEGWYVSE